MIKLIKLIYWKIRWEIIADCLCQGQVWRWGRCFCGNTHSKAIKDLEAAERAAHVNHLAFRQANPDLF